MSLRKLVRVVSGFALVGVGLVMALPGVPGPGLLIALGGLVLLSEHFHWARRVLDWARQKASEAQRKARGGGKPDRVARS